MSVTRGEVERIAALARLELGEGETESLRNDLNGILGHMETLGQAGAAGGGGTGTPGSGQRPSEGEPESTDGRGPDNEEIEAAHRSGAAPLREDGEASPDPLSLPPDELAPRWEDGFFSVPRLPGLDEEGSP